MANSNHDGDVDSDLERDLNVDYYTFLNVSKNAAPEDIVNAYRRLSKLYHPDKHVDPKKKKDAELLFSKTKQAYEVLNDPHRRAIYDTLGVKGLETEGWEIVQRTKTPQEIREEYERLAREREERRLQQRTNPKGTITVEIDATELFETYNEDFEDNEKESLIPNIEVSSMSISQSVDAPLTISNTATLSGTLSTQNGTGNGAITTSLRHIHSAKMWTEYEVQAGSGLVLAAKCFRSISNRCFGTVRGVFYVTPLGIRPGFRAVLGRQLDRYTMGYLSWKTGTTSSSMTTTVVWDSSKGYMSFSLQIGIPSSYLSFSYSYNLGEEGAKVKGSVRLGTLGTFLEYGCEKKISEHSVLGASVMLGVPSGVTLKIKLTRASQNYVFPIMLAQELLPNAVFYGTLMPLIGWYSLKVLVINPYQEKQKRKENEKAREANASRLAEQRREAEAAVSLMTETYTRIVSQERDRGGLIIIEALYGSLESIEQRSEREEEESNSKSTVVDVKIPLQCLVKDSQLVLPDAAKSNLPGFYDPCLGEDKHLLVKYLFRNLNHDVTIKDNEPLKIPNENHTRR